ncbi:FecR domain-containing protein [Cupriavidus nantongensis]|uniref:FecR domain-containing protein n=1 Tax=Cupriavidus nantongensis TaxID=1796606 RepID=UPI0022481CCE|nr:FecR domain-containing protein [Cupriavidus nantongensis]
MPLPAAPQPPIDAAITLRATQWWLALQSPDASLARRDGCARWRAEHPDHERAWQHLHDCSAALASMPRGVARAALSISPPRPGRRRAIALLAATVVAAGSWQWQRGGALLARRADHATGIGERQRVTLQDGTEIDLDTDSAIAVDYGEAERRVTLLRGAIAVATGADVLARPFRVGTAQGTLRALGTRFTVQLHDDATAVAVQAGAVEIRPADPAAAPRVLQAGERTRFSRAQIDPPEPGDVADTAWTQGMLAVHDMRLDRFLAQLARYRHGRLGCSGDAAGLRVSGIFPLDDTDRVLDALPHLLPVSVERWTRYWVSVRRRT